MDGSLSRWHSAHMYRCVGVLVHSNTTNANAKKDANVVDHTKSKKVKDKTKTHTDIVTDIDSDRY